MVDPMYGEHATFFFFSWHKDVTIYCMEIFLSKTEPGHDLDCMAVDPTNHNFLRLLTTCCKAERAEDEVQFRRTPTSILGP